MSGREKCRLPQPVGGLECCHPEESGRVKWLSRLQSHTAYVQIPLVRRDSGKFI